MTTTTVATSQTRAYRRSEVGLAVRRSRTEQYEVRQTEEDPGSS